MFDGVAYNSLEPNLMCHVVWVSNIDLGEDGLPPLGYTDLSTCPLFLKQMDESSERARERRISTALSAIGSNIRNIPMQEWMFRNIQRNVYGHMCVLAPRGSGKTTAAITAMAIELNPFPVLQSIYFCINSDAAVQLFYLIRKILKAIAGNTIKAIDVGLVTGSVGPANLERFKIIVGTPHDIIRLVELRNINLDHLSTLFLDDGDMTFTTSKIHEFVDRLNKTRLIYLSTAIKEKLCIRLQTMHCNHMYVNGLAKAPMKTYQSTDTKVVHARLGTNAIKHYCRVVNAHTKLVYFNEMVNLMKSGDQAIVFCNEKKNAELLFQNLKKDHDVVMHSGDMELADREEILQGFLKGKGKLLICTDALSRGMVFHNVRIAISFDIPMKMCKDDTRTWEIDCLSYENRVHSCGKCQLAFSFANIHEFSKLKAKINVHLLVNNSVIVQ
ncbi:uncharacterized protein LOC129571965 [Sitodiplosis mosellana]|uniref:uncharacterized protein LOC129571965 n=1 Tax=Sitodiplosis mosellana TaxID=263140 RepID=UPI002444F0A0|nr:uncharacterized protein LOC129571965 [Sitodiplosis mosellana]